MVDLIRDLKFLGEFLVVKGLPLFLFFLGKKQKGNVHFSGAEIMSPLLRDGFKAGIPNAA